MGKEVIKSFKAFDKDMKCRDFQYEVGKTYEESEAKACSKGFHGCENPFAVLNYYPLVDNGGNMSRFAEVEQSGEIDRDGDKVCSSRISIKAELSLAGFVKACVEWIKEATQKLDVKNVDNRYSAKIGSSGYSAKIGSSGDSAKIGSSGDSAQIGSSGDSAQIGSSGYSAQIGSSGDYAQIGSSGDYAKIGSSGDYAKIGSSGYSAQIGSSGSSAQIGSSGDYAQIGSSGYSAKIGSSGYSAQIGSEGKHAVICCAGHGSVVKAKVGSWITLSEWKYDEVEKAYIPVCVKTEKVDGERIKGDTAYKLVNGQFVEV